MHQGHRQTTKMQVPNVLPDESRHPLNLGHPGGEDDEFLTTTDNSENMSTRKE